MEPKDWKDEILEMEMIGLEDTQKEMLLKILSDDFYISNEFEKCRLRVIVDNGCYYEWDRGYLNGLRGAYLKGVNWIKPSKLGNVMILSAEQREGIHKMMSWINSGDEDIQLSSDRVRDREFLKDQLLKVLLLDEYDGKDKVLLNQLRRVYLDSNSV